MQCTTLHPRPAGLGSCSAFSAQPRDACSHRLFRGRTSQAVAIKHQERKLEKQQEKQQQEKTPVVQQQALVTQPPPNNPLMSNPLSGIAPTFWWSILSGGNFAKQFLGLFKLRGEAVQAEKALREASRQERSKAAVRLPADVRKFLHPVGVWELKYVRKMASLVCLTYQIASLTPKLIMQRHGLDLITTSRACELHPVDVPDLPDWAVDSFDDGDGMAAGMPESSYDSSYESMDELDDETAAAGAAVAPAVARGTRTALAASRAAAGPTTSNNNIVALPLGSNWRDAGRAAATAAAAAAAAAASASGSGQAAPASGSISGRGPPRGSTSTGDGQAVEIGSGEGSRGFPGWLTLNVSGFLDRSRGVNVLPAPTPSTSTTAASSEPLPNPRGNGFKSILVGSARTMAGSGSSAGVSGSSTSSSNGSSSGSSGAALVGVFSNSANGPVSSLPAGPVKSGGSTYQTEGSCPSEWFVCDDASTNTRYFVIQGSDTLEHWRLNLTFDPVIFEDPALGVKVHRGVLDGAKVLYERFLPLVYEHRDSSPTAKICFLGHSVGGALATLIMMLYAFNGVLTADQLATTYTFGSPAVFCELGPSPTQAAGDTQASGPDAPSAAEPSAGVLAALGLREDSIRNVMMHRDIVPRAFACDYSMVADLLKSWGNAFREQPSLMLDGRKHLYYFLGKMIVLQPDTWHSFSSSEPYHPMLPDGPGIFLLDQPTRTTAAAAAEARQRDEAAAKPLGTDVENLHEAIFELMDTPHPLETLGDPGAYLQFGSISRYHNPEHYRRAINRIVHLTKAAEGSGRGGTASGRLAGRERRRRFQTLHRKQREAQQQLAGQLAGLSGDVDASTAAAASSTGGTRVVGRGIEEAEEEQAAGQLWDSSEWDAGRAVPLLQDTTASYLMDPVHY